MTHGALAAGKGADVPVNWSGFYIGGNAGGAWARDRMSTIQFIPPVFIQEDADAIGASSSPTVHPHGFMGGAQGGYNLLYGNWVGGVELDISGANLDGSNGGTFPFPSTLPGGNPGPPTVYYSTVTTVSTDWLFTARPRLGYAVESWLFYVTGGLAVGNEKFSQTITLLGGFVENASFSRTRVGWTAGAGAEYALDSHWSLKGEWLYVDLGTENTTGAVTPPFAGLSTANSVDLTMNIVRAGINYRF